MVDVVKAIHLLSNLRRDANKFKTETPGLKSITDDGITSLHPADFLFDIMDTIEEGLFAKYGKDMIKHGRLMDAYYQSYKEDDVSDLP